MISLTRTFSRHFDRDLAERAVLHEPELLTIR